MPDANPTFVDGVCTVLTATIWLNANGELPLCLAQPSLVDLAAISSDAPRPDSLALAEAIFGDEDGQPRLSRWFGRQSGLLIFPEYAFSSADFEALNRLISQHPEPLIAIGGFGAVEGGILRDLLGECVATWEDGAQAIDPQNKYNGGWCWIHHGAGDSTCYLFLKNFLEQQFEIAIDGLTTGESILRVETQDLCLFPLICADLICQQPNNARTRITNSLALQPPNRANVLVVAPLYTNRPQSGHWSGVINDIVSMNGRCAGLILVNQLAAPLFLEPQEDQWRNLSGSFVHKHIMPGAPPRQFQAVRYVSTDQGSGLVLRQSLVGVAFGSFQWVNAVELGRMWTPQHRVLEPNGFRRLTDGIAYQELQRYVSRRQTLISDRYHVSAKLLILGGLDRIQLEVNNTYLAPRLWPRLLSGVEEEPGSTSVFDPDKIDTHTAALDRALAVYTAIEQSSGAAALVSDTADGQLQLEESEILIWKSPLYDWRKMWQVLKALSVKPPHGPQLLVVGGGREGQSNAGPIEPDKSVDYTTIPKIGDITSARHRHIFWRPLGEIENSLTDPNTTVAQKRTTIVSQLAAI